MLTARLSFAEPLFVNIFTCKARKASKDELASLLTELCIKTATEPGCRRCDYMVANKDALSHTMIQVYDSFDEWSKHERTPHGRKFFQKSPNLMASHWHTSCVSWYPVTPAGFALPPYLRQGMGDSISASEMAISVVTLAVKPHLDLQVLDAAKRKSQVSLENRLLLRCDVYQEVDEHHAMTPAFKVVMAAKSSLELDNHIDSKQHQHWLKCVGAMCDKVSSKRYKGRFPAAPVGWLSKVPVEDTSDSLGRAEVELGAATGMGTYSLKGGDEEVNAKSTVSFSWEVTEVRRKSQLDGDGEERRLILKNIACADLKDRDDGEGYDGDVSDPFVRFRCGYRHVDTTHQLDNLNPKWEGEEVSLPLLPVLTLPVKIRVECWDWDKGIRPCQGERNEERRPIVASATRSSMCAPARLSTRAPSSAAVPKSPGRASTSEGKSRKSAVK